MLIQTRLAANAPWPRYIPPKPAAKRMTRTQQSILSMLGLKPMCVAELAAARGITWQACSKQLRHMKTQGLINQRMEPLFGERLQVVYFVEEA